MDPTVRDLWTEDHLSDLAQRYGSAVGSLAPLDGFESFVFADRREDRVLRVGHGSRRPRDMVRGEVEWLTHLADHDAGVAEAQPSRAGRLVESLDDGAGGEFIAVAFRRASGEHLAIPRWTPKFARHYGAVLGRMHRVSIDFRPRFRRPDWDDPTMLDVRRHIPTDQPRVREAWDEVLVRLQSRACPPSRFGLIHQDAHGGNFMVHAGQITLFDFDDCCYAPYAMEIGIVIFYAAVLSDEPDTFGSWFVPNFLAGYRSEFDGALDPAVVADCVALREIDTYSVIHRDGEQDSTHPWTSGFMRERRECIERGRPVIHLRREWFAPSG